MKTYYQNLKKCLTCSALVLGFALSPSANASKLPVDSLVRNDLKNHQSRNFEGLLKKWNRSYGKRAVRPLTEILFDSEIADSKRYIALMAIARIEGHVAKEKLVKSLQDGSWMIRMAAIRAIRYLHLKTAGDSVIKLLKDPALVVRNEAVQTIQKLQPKGSMEALLKTLEDKTNYHGGVGQWVPQKALQAIAKMKPKQEIARKLLPLLERKKDPNLVRQTILTLESITGKSFDRKAKLADQVEVWKTALAETPEVEAKP